MLTLTLLTNKDGTILYKTDNIYVQVIGEFLTNDAHTMPDFIRALLTSDDEETIPLDACLIETNDTFFIIKHLHLKNLPIITLSKKRMIQILDVWEDFLEQKNPTQWIFFNEEEFGLSIQQNNPSQNKWEKMEEKLAHLHQKKKKSKEQE